MVWRSVCSHLCLLTEMPLSPQNMSGIRLKVWYRLQCGPVGRDVKGEVCQSGARLQSDVWLRFFFLLVL